MQVIKKHVQQAHQVHQMLQLTQHQSQSLSLLQLTTHHQLQTLLSKLLSSTCHPPAAASSKQIQSTVQLRLYWQKVSSWQRTCLRQFSDSHPVMPPPLAQPVLMQHLPKDRTQT